MVTRRQISRYEIYMTSGWVCTCEGLVVDLQVNQQNDATFNSDREFRCVRLDCFSPSSESTPAFIVCVVQFNLTLILAFLIHESLSPSVCKSHFPLSLSA